MKAFGRTDVGSTGRAARSLLVAGLVTLGVSCGSSKGSTSAGSPTSTPMATKSSTVLTVVSTLDGQTTLPHRIRWRATPSSTDVSEVDFLIDGAQLWVEHNPPYDYGDDGNYLVTSFLEPGSHRFMVRAVALDGSTAEATVTATVASPPPPPAALAGTWKGSRHGGGAPSGTWRLIISSEGWQIEDPEGGGNRVDVAYLHSGLLEVRTGMATGHEGHDLNGWCNDEPGSPVRYGWSVKGKALRLTSAGGTPCPGFTEFITGPWSRA
jgi:hypothetical protein